MVKMYLYAENEVPGYSGLKVKVWTDRHTLYADDNKYHSSFIVSKHSRCDYNNPMGKEIKWKEWYIEF